MLFRDVARLVAVTPTEDKDGYETTAEAYTEVFVDVKSVKREEFYRSMHAGRELVIAFDIRACDYGGQTRIEYDGKQYKIERSYTKDGEIMELNCSAYKGDKP